MPVQARPRKLSNLVLFASLAVASGVIAVACSTAKDDARGDNEATEDTKDPIATDDISTGDGQQTTTSVATEIETEVETEVETTTTTTTPSTEEDISIGKFDLEFPDVPADCGGEEYEFSILWVADSQRGTVSKIDTITAKELARYRTGPKIDADPSRTAVNLDGAVAVANRTGSVTMFAAREAECIDRNGDGVITTSHGPNEVLDWEKDECMIWHHDLGWNPVMKTESNDGGPRALAWDAGVIPDPSDPCSKPVPRLWVGWRDDKAINVAKIRRITIDGQVDDEVDIPNWSCEWSHGIYGGLADKDGNFWGTGSRGTLVRVDADTFDVKRYDFDLGPQYLFYGIALDADNNVWLASYQLGAVIKFDPNTEKFQVFPAPNPGGVTLRGIMVDRDGILWAAANTACSLQAFNTKTNTWISPHVTLPECLEPVGISLDAQNNVWVVDREAARAYRYNPMTKEMAQVTGFEKPYTYSDMTGYALNLVDDPPK